MQDIKNIRWLKDLPEDFQGVDISTEFCGFKMQSPIYSSGPLSYAAEGLIRAHEAGAGAVVTKNNSFTKSPKSSDSYISKMNKDSLINCEKWAGSAPEVWFEREIPIAKAAGAVCRCYC